MNSSQNLRSVKLLLRVYVRGLGTLPLERYLQRIWRFKASEFYNLASFHTDMIQYVTHIASVGKYATCGRDGSVCVWSLPTYSVLRFLRFTMLQATTRIYDTFHYTHPSAGKYATCGRDGSVRFWSLPTYNPTCSTSVKHLQVGL